MKNIWVLSVRTTLPATAEKYLSFCGIPTVYYTFENFAAARQKMREVLKQLYVENAMFDSNGEIIRFKDLLDQYLDDNKYEDEEDETNEDYEEENEGSNSYLKYYNEYILSTKVLVSFYKAIKGVLNGEDVILNIESGEYRDFTNALVVKNGDVKLFGCEEGPCNNINPFIETNAFTMDEEKDYHLYIKDQFFIEPWESSIMMIDLIKTELNQ